MSVFRNTCSFKSHFPQPQGYLIKEGNLSREAVNMIGDIMNEDGGFYTSFLHSAHDFVTFYDDDR